MYNVRLYQDSDYEKLQEWWKSFEEQSPDKEMIPSASTLIMSNDDKDLCSMSIYLTNCKPLAYLENLISNPELSKEERNESVKYLVGFAEHFAKAIGYTRLVCYSYKDKLKERYQDLGYQNTCNNLSSFVKEIK